MIKGDEDECAGRHPLNHLPNQRRLLRIKFPAGGSIPRPVSAMEDLIGKSIDGAFDQDQFVVISPDLTRPETFDTARRKAGKSIVFNFIAAEACAIVMREQRVIAPVGADAADKTFKAENIRPYSPARQIGMFAAGFCLLPSLQDGSPVTGDGLKIVDKQAALKDRPCCPGPFSELFANLPEISTSPVLQEVDNCAVITGVPHGKINPSAFSFLAGDNDLVAVCVAHDR